jgi:hypothetical protein
MNTSRHLVAALLCSGSLIFSACGSSNATKKTASKVATAQSVTPGNGASTTVKKSDEEAAMDLTKCMRANGVTIADPTVDAEGNVKINPPVNDPNLPKALEACQKEMKGTTFGGGPDQQGKFKDALFQFTKCLRDQGLQVGDVDLSKPPTGAGGATGGDPGSIEFLAQLIPGLDPRDPKAQAAVTTCKPKLTEAMTQSPVGK